MFATEPHDQLYWRLLGQGDGIAPEAEATELTAEPSYWFAVDQG